MKLVLAAVGLFVSLATVGIACGPKEKFCYAEGETCEQVKRDKEQADRQSEASDAADAEKICVDNNGNIIPCAG
jgi:hypothetical protein